MKKIALALILLATPALARNGEFLNAMCQSSEVSELGAGFCLGAVGSILQVMESGNSINGMTACFPTDFATTDAINTVMQYLEISEELREFNIHSAVATIFWLEFRCVN